MDTLAVATGHLAEGDPIPLRARVCATQYRPAHASMYKGSSLPVNLSTEKKGRLTGKHAGLGLAEPCGDTEPNLLSEAPAPPNLTERLSTLRPDRKKYPSSPPCRSPLPFWYRYLAVSHGYGAAGPPTCLEQSSSSGPRPEPFTAMHARTFRTNRSACRGQSSSSSPQPYLRCKRLLQSSSLLRTYLTNFLV